MPLPSFTVVGNLYEITGEIFASELLESAPTTLRFTFTPNLSSLTTPVTYDGNLYKVGIVYGGIKNDGTILQASMVNGQVVTSSDPIKLLAEDDGLNVSGLMWKVALETPVETRWQELTSWWIDAYADGATVDLADVSVGVEANASPISRISPTAVRQLTDTSFVFTVNGVDIPSPVDIGTSLVTDFDFRLDDERTPTDASVTLAKIEPTLSAALTNVSSPFFVTTTTHVLNAETADDATNKTARYGVPNRTNGSAPHYGMVLQSSSTANLTNVGGGSAAGYAATQVRFYTGATNTTTTGTIRGYIDSAGIAYFLNDVRVGEPTGGERLLALDCAAGNQALVQFARGGDGRWAITSTSDAETGSDAGTDLTVVSYTDAGAVKATVLTFSRATGAATFSGTVITAASASGGAGLRLPHGSAPSAPTNGDLWTTTSGLFARINGSSEEVATTASLSGKEDTITAGTTSQYFRGDKTFQTLNAAAISDSTATGRSLLTAADAAAGRTALAVAYGSTAGTVAQGNDGRLNAAAFLAPVAYTSGQYFFCNSQGNSSTGGTTNNTVRVTPWLVTDSITISRLFAEATVVGESGSVFRFGIWNDDGAGKPGTLLLDAGTAATDSSTGAFEVTVSQALSPGIYWVGGAVQSAPATQPTLRLVNSTTLPTAIPLGSSLPATTNAASFIQGSVTGAFSDFTASPSISTTAPRIGFKVA